MGSDSGSKHNRDSSCDDAVSDKSNVESMDTVWGKVRVPSLAIVALLALLASMLGAVSAARADSGAVSGTITASDPTYTHLSPVPGNACAAGSESSHYRVIKATITGTTATNFSVTATPDGFTANMAVYQGVFLPEAPVVNCFDARTGAAPGAPVSYSIPLVAPLAGFDTQIFYIVVSGATATDLGDFDVSVSSSALPVVVSLEPGGGTPVDTTAPVVTVPGNATLEAVGPGGTPFGFSATAMDEVDGALVPTCTPASGWTFPLGETTVTCSATDAAGNSGSASFTVTVEDTTGPAFNNPGLIQAEATSSAGAIVTFDVNPHDLVEGTLPGTCVPASGTTFSIGTTTVTCAATDSSGNASSMSMAVQVSDTTLPTLALPSEMVLEATDPTGATATFSATATDTVDGTVPVVCVPASGTPFGLGATVVDCTATDAAGNSATGSFNVMVADTTAPELSPLADLTLEATGADGATVIFAPTASDLVDGDLLPTCTPGSGTILPLGDTLVECAVTDSSGNTATDSFTVTVTDTTAPVITVPHNMELQATSKDGARVTYSVTATDIVDGDSPVSCTPASGSTLMAGITEIVCSATDAANNVATASFTVQVAAFNPTQPTEPTKPTDPTEPTKQPTKPANISPKATPIRTGHVLAQTGAEEPGLGTLAPMLLISGVASLVWARRRRLIRTSR